MDPAIPHDIIAVGSLAANAEILVDRWGIPHIRAGSLDDLFLAQGFNAARDRLFQLDIWRKRGLGILAADFGPGFLAQDRAARAFLYRGDLALEYAAYGDDTKAICTAFAAGINACIDLCAREPARLPPEFSLLGITPGKWMPEDVLRIRSHALSKNALSEVVRAQVLTRSDAATDALRKAIEPPRALVAGLDLASVPPDAGDLFKLASAVATFTPERLAARLDEAALWSRVSDLGEVMRQPESENSVPQSGAAPPVTMLHEPPEEGSNTWAIHGSRTATGRPILASDPHRAHSLPSLRYLVHLSAPGFDAIGAGEPSQPGISIGHNDTIAFGLTIFGGDQEDVFVYETHPDNGNLYRYLDGWEEMRVVEETVRVKGCPDQVVTLKFTRHGPVTSENQARHTAAAIRSVWFEPGASAYAASLSTMRTRNLPDFQRELRRWAAPSVNMSYADITGTIGWLPAGYHPVRPNWDGLLPVPGNGSHEWNGFLDPDALPRVANPAIGYIYSANELNLPADWPHEARRVGHEWTENSRAIRISEALAAIPFHILANSTALQTDVLSVPARRICAILAKVAVLVPPGSKSGNKETLAALSLLEHWDHRLEAASPAAALFEVWFSKHLKPALFARLVPDVVTRALLAPGDIAGILAAIEKPDSRFGPNRLQGRDTLLLASLTEAYRDCIVRLGTDPSLWAWGSLHHGYFEHPLSTALGKDRSGFDVGPLPKGGSASTPMHTGYRPSDFRITHGASVRIVMDVGDWDKSLCLNGPGQSGDPRSPHYADLAQAWASGGYVPMLYSREKIDPEVVYRITLVRG